MVRRGAILHHGGRDHVVRQLKERGDAWRLDNK
jgi:hypothetical protein